MLILDRQTQSREDAQFRELPDRLHGDELVVVNNARVIPARLLGRRVGVHAEEPGRNSRISREQLSSEIEVLLTKQVSPAEWEALVRPGKKVRVGERVVFGEGELSAEVLSRGDFGLRRVRLTATGDLTETIERLGHIPLPPYIGRGDDLEDRERYQTIFAQQPGAVAAPTAGLHFSSEILQRVKERGIEIVPITLDVGLGTFQPVHEERIEDHHIHAERYEISEQAASAIGTAKRQGRRIIAVGTTVVRALEDAAAKAAGGSGEHAGAESAGSKALLYPGIAAADIFIVPGHRFRVVDELFTNFHLPESTLLVLVCAFAGREFVLANYEHAVKTGYRFYSYGDCMWIR